VFLFALYFLGMGSHPYLFFINKVFFLHVDPAMFRYYQLMDVRSFYKSLAIKVVGKAQRLGCYHNEGAKVAAEGGTLYFGDCLI
jgi:hypothetical protein